MMKNSSFALWVGLFGLVAVAGTYVSIAGEHPVTTEPGQAAAERILHSFFPMRESDEAYDAVKRGEFTQDDLNRLTEGADEDYFHDMDYGITHPANQDHLRLALNPFVSGITQEDAVHRVVRGRNNWLVWTAGNDRFWNYMTRATFGSLDFLKTVSDHPNLPATRANRWQELGLVNEPCYEKAIGPDPERWGLWLPKRSKDCPPDPFSDEHKYPGVKSGARGRTIEVGSFYGYPTGVVGLRLFPNPDFDERAAKHWDAKRYYEDPAYYYDPNLVRPYRVGMACAFCHVGPNPTRPPSDFNNPKWENLSSNVGAQYFWVDRIFFWDYKKHQESFVFQLLHTQRPGSLDTSLVSSDEMNNARTMNAIYDLPARVALAKKMNFAEQLRGPELKNAQFSQLSTREVPGESVLRRLYDPESQKVVSPRILKDGSDSVGALGALNRVYVNIGLFSEDWVQNFVPIVGGPWITPFKIEAAEKKSLFWKATTAQTPDVAMYFLTASRPDKLSSAPHGSSYLKTIDSPEVHEGKKVFARNCAACHSSKLPEKAYSFFNTPSANCNGKNYLNCWNAYWNYARTEEFKDEMEKIALRKDFLEHNYLSTELRVPVSLLDTYLCTPLATNAIKGNIWDNFSASSYKELPSAGKFRVNFPAASGASELQSEVEEVPAGGRGYLRPASLISIWSTAPFLSNNSVGKFDERGTVAGRMSSFEDSIDKLLNPEHRGQSGHPGRQSVEYTTSFGDRLPGTVDVTTTDTYLMIPRGYIPDFLFDLVKETLKLLPGFPGEFISSREPLDPVETWREPKKNWLQRMIASGPSSKKEDREFIHLGPIPAGVPINLIADIDVGAIGPAQTEGVIALVRAVGDIKAKHLKGEAARRYFMEKAAPALVKADKCRDFVVDRGHYFGTQYAADVKSGASKPLSEGEKSALIEFLKHL